MPKMLLSCLFVSSSALITSVLPREEDVIVLVALCVLFREVSSSSRFLWCAVSFDCDTSSPSSLYLLISVDIDKIQIYREK